MTIRLENGIRRLLALGGPAAGVLLFLALWEAGAAWYDDFLLPAPGVAMARIVSLAGEGALCEAVGLTTGRALLGFLLAALVGTALGMMAGLLPTLGRMLEPVSTMLLGIPPIAWVVLAILWFGSGLMAPVFTVAVTGLPISFAGAQIGVLSRDPRLDEMADGFGLRGWRRLLDVTAPQVISHVFPAWITTLGVAWKVTVMVELFVAPSGIGAGLATARTNLDTTEAMAWILVVVALLLAFEHGLLRPLQRQMEPWRRTAGASP